MYMLQQVVYSHTVYVHGISLSLIAQSLLELSAFLWLPHLIRSRHRHWNPHPHSNRSIRLSQD